MSPRRGKCKGNNIDVELRAIKDFLQLSDVLVTDWLILLELDNGGVFLRQLLNPLFNFFPINMNVFSFPADRIFSVSLPPGSRSVRAAEEPSLFR